MKARAASALLNTALAGGIAVAVALAVGFSLFYSPRPATTPTASLGNKDLPLRPDNRAEVFLPMAPRPGKIESVPAPPMEVVAPPTAAEAPPAVNAPPPTVVNAPPPTAASAEPPPAAVAAAPEPATVPGAAPAPQAPLSPRPSAVVPSLSSSSSPATAPSLPPLPSLGVSLPPPTPLRAAADRFEPPPPPTVAAVPLPKPLTAIPNGVSIEPPQSDAAVTVHAGDEPPALKAVELEAHDIHPVPDRDKPTRPVTIMNRQGKVLAVTHADPSAGEATAPPIPPPSARDATPTRAEERAPAANSPPQKLAMTAPKAPPRHTMANANLVGTAIVTGALELNVDGRPLRLYGLKPPGATDMCAPSERYAARNCLDVSREALSALVGHDNRLSCRVLSSGSGANPAVCQDDKGTDLGHYLVARGFALVDANEIVDYSGSEAQARSAGLGLWHNR